MAEAKIKSSALTEKQLVDLIRNVGSNTMTEAILESHIARGAPVNTDGTFNLLEYTAWLILENSK